MRVPWIGDSQDVCAELPHPPQLAKGRGAREWNRAGQLLYQLLTCEEKPLRKHLWKHRW